jgi:hypothetical protein
MSGSRSNGGAPRLVPAFSSVTARRDFLNRRALDNNPATTQHHRESQPHPTDKMSDHTKQTRNAMNAKKQEIQNQEQQRAEWADQVSYNNSFTPRAQWPTRRIRIAEFPVP